MTRPHSWPRLTLASGPVDVPTETLRAMLQPMVYHYDPVFLDTFRRVEALAKQVFQTDYDVIVMQGEAVLALESAQSVVVAQQARVLREFDRREAFRADACTTTASWLRWKTSLGYGPAQRRVKRARLLGRMPGLRGAYETGQVATEHVDAVAYRATGWRAARIVEHRSQARPSAAPPRHFGCSIGGCWRGHLISSQRLPRCSQSRRSAMVHPPDLVEASIVPAKHQRLEELLLRDAVLIDRTRRNAVDMKRQVIDVPAEPDWAGIRMAVEDVLAPALGESPRLPAGKDLSDQRRLENGVASRQGRLCSKP